jgi:hypothetical protein
MGGWLFTLDYAGWPGELTTSESRRSVSSLVWRLREALNKSLPYKSRPYKSALRKSRLYKSSLCKSSLYRFLLYKSLL